MYKNSNNSLGVSRSYVMSTSDTCHQHEGQPFTNFCSAPECIRALCPQCVENHYEFHKQTNNKPELESFKTVKQKCNKKIKEILEVLNTESEKCGINKNMEVSKTYDATLKKLKETKEIIERAVKQYFSKMQEMIKKKINLMSSDDQISKIMETTEHINKQLENLQKELDVPQRFIENVVKIIKLDNKRLVNKISDDYKKIKELRDKFDINLIVETNIEQNLYSLLSKHISIGSNQQINNAYISPYLEKSVSTRLKSEQSESASSLNRKKSEAVIMSKKQLSENGSQKASQKSKRTQKSRAINIIGLNTFKEESKRKYLHFFQNDDNFLHILDLNSNRPQFTQIKLDINFKVPYFHKSISTPNGDLYLIGGSIPNSTIKSQKIYKFDFQNKTLTYCTSLKYGRSSHALCFNTKYIYIVGGFLNNQLITNKCQRFDIISNKVQDIQNCNHPVNSLSLSSFNGRYIFKFGGNGLAKEIVHYIEKYDQKIGNWIVLNPIFQGITNEFSLLSTSAAIQITPNDIMVFGGYDENNEGYKQTYILNVQGQNYTIKDINVYPLPFAEAFWNNTPIIQNRMVFALQNLATTDKQDCIENDRRVLTFNGSEWRALN